MLITRSVRDSI